MSSERGARPKAINLFSIIFAKMEFIKPFYYAGTSPQIHTLTPHLQACQTTVA